MGNKPSTIEASKRSTTQPNDNRKKRVKDPTVLQRVEEEVKKNPTQEIWSTQVIMNDAHGTVSGISIDNETGTLFFASNNWHLYKLSAYYQDKAIELLRGEKYRQIVWNGKNTIYYCHGSTSKVKDYVGSYCVDSSNDNNATKETIVMNSFDFCNLSGITLDKKTGCLYVSDRNRICKISSPGASVEIVAGSDQRGHQDGEATQAKFFFPLGLVAYDGVIYVADNLNHCIRKIHNGIVSTLTGRIQNSEDEDEEDEGPSVPFKRASFRNPRDICFDRNGDLLVCDDHGVKRIDMKHETVAKLRFIPQLSQVMQCLCTDKKGKLFLGGTSSLYMAEKASDATWCKAERYLWIGKLKEEPNSCLLATLPSDLIKEISKWL